MGRNQIFKFKMSNNKFIMINNDEPFDNSPDKSVNNNISQANIQIPLNNFITSNDIPRISNTNIHNILTRIENTDNIQQSFKCIMIGDGGVGKTSLINKCIGHELNRNYYATCGSVEHLV